MRNEPLKIEWEMVKWIAIVAGITAGVFVQWGWQAALLALIVTPIAMVVGFFLLLMICAIVS